MALPHLPSERMSPILDLCLEHVTVRAVRHGAQRDVLLPERAEGIPKSEHAR